MIANPNKKSAPKQIVPSFSPRQMGDEVEALKPGRYLDPIGNHGENVGKMFKMLIFNVAMFQTHD
jgi:hypothetical protein